MTDYNEYENRVCGNDDSTNESLKNAGSAAYISKSPYLQHPGSSDGDSTAKSEPYSYHPNFVLPQTPGYTTVTPPQSSQQPQKAKTRSGRGCRIAGLAAAFVIFCAGAFGFGYLGSWTALQNAVDSDTAITSDPVGSDESDASAVVGNTVMAEDLHTTVADVADAVSDSVVEITTESVQTDRYFRQQITSGAGSGVIVSKDGYIVTNHHVVNGADGITVTLRDGSQYEGRLVGTDEKTDLAVVKIAADGLVPVSLGSSAGLKVGEPAIAIGNPLGQLGGTVTDGIISALDREITIDGETMTLLQTNAAINPGNSGGGLFNAKGELIGIVNAKSGGTTAGTTIEGLGFAIPIDTVKPVLDDLITHGYVQGRIDIGMTFLEITDPITAMMYGVNGTGVYVTGVTDGSSTAKTGIRAGDRIVALADEYISSTDDIKTILAKYKVGDEISVVVERNGYQGSGTLVLEEYHGTASADGNFLQ